MAIKYLRGNVAPNSSSNLLTFRPVGFAFPKASRFSIPPLPTTVDLLVVAGGGAGGYQGGTYGAWQGGGGGGGGFRLSTGNTTSNLLLSPTGTFPFATTNVSCIPVVVGGSAGASCIGVGSIGVVCSERGGHGEYAWNNPGGSGSGGANHQPSACFGCGIAGQGCNGGGGGGPSPGGPVGGGGGAAGAGQPGPGGGTGGSGTPSSFTGAPVTYSAGGNGPAPQVAGAVNTGSGGRGRGTGSAGGSGIVAIRYCNPAAPTTPLMTGGNTVCCTGGCIIHIFTSSGFINAAMSFNIN